MYSKRSHHITRGSYVAMSSSVLHHVWCYGVTELRSSTHYVVCSSTVMSSYGVRYDGICNMYLLVLLMMQLHTSVEHAHDVTDDLT